MNNIKIVILFVTFNFLVCNDNSQIPIEKLGLLYGSIVDSVTNHPIKGALLQLYHNLKHDTTDNSGKFEFNDLNLGIDTLFITADGYNSLKQQVVISKDTKPITIFLNKQDIDYDPCLDTNRVYLSPRTGNPMTIYLRALFTRFHPDISDTSEIIPLLNEYNLDVHHFIALDQAWAAFLCIKDGSRPECYFTPYGKKNVENFGSNPMVEYCFGLFNDGWAAQSGNIEFWFKEGVSQASIDSLYNHNGLRFLWKSLSGSDVTVVTPAAPKNILELSEELKHESIVQLLEVGVWSIQNPIQCN